MAGQGQAGPLAGVIEDQIDQVRVANGSHIYSINWIGVPSLAFQHDLVVDGHACG